MRTEDNPVEGDAVPADIDTLIEMVENEDANTGEPKAAPSEVRVRSIPDEFLNTNPEKGLTSKEVTECPSE